MSNILIITSRNISKNTGDATLLLKRSSAIYKVFNHESYFISVNETLKNEHCDQEGIKFITQRRNIIATIYYTIINIQPNVIILSGEKTYFLRPIIGIITKLLQRQIRFYLDIHGALEEEIEYLPESNFRQITSYIRYYFKKILFRCVARSSTGLICVTDELFDNYLKLLPEEIGTNLKKVKIRCGVDELIDSEHRQEYRTEIRKLWRIKPETVVFVYSGYRMAWQKTNEILHIFRELDKTLDNSFFVFFTNLDNDFQNEVSRTLPRRNFYLRHLEPNELKKYLSGCDIGFLVRDNNLTNRVAFPNKFSEYINSGLMLAISSSLYEPMSVLQKNDIPFILINNDNPYATDFSNYSLRGKDITAFYEICEKLCEKELLYSEQVRHNNEIALW